MLLTAAFLSNAFLHRFDRWDFFAHLKMENDQQRNQISVEIDVWRCAEPVLHPNDHTSTWSRSDKQILTAFPKTNREIESKAKFLQFSYASNKYWISRDVCTVTPVPWMPNAMLQCIWLDLCWACNRIIGRSATTRTSDHIDEFRIAFSTLSAASERASAPRASSNDFTAQENKVLCNVEDKWNCVHAASYVYQQKCPIRSRLWPRQASVSRTNDI